MLNKSGESGHPCLVPDLRRKLLAFTTEYDVNCELIIYGLYYVEVHPLYIHFVGKVFVFIINGC